MLTKEECLNELKKSRFLEASIINQNGETEYSCNFEETTIFNTFRQLIEEHFSNPPLTFEEIESGKPIWDNKNKEWLFVNNALSISSEVKGKSYKKFMKVGYKGRRNFLNVEQSEIDFELNRFYRKEVQE